jgi:D-glycero-alpha-D-manno-heptose 1-phosphate guanylyltransferase
MISEAIILAGGLGTRLRSAVPDLPKCMAPVAGKPFISYVIKYFQQQGIERFIFSLGYKQETIQDFLEKNFPSLNYSCSIEDEPLGTGGAIMKACSLSVAGQLLILNGDTLFEINLDEVAAFHEGLDADCTLSLKPMHHSERYGVVEIDHAGRISSFKEKKWYAESLINGGVYSLNREAFLNESLPEKFSFEKDYLEKFYMERKMNGIVQDTYFIDIGIPEDFEKAQLDFAGKNK